MADTSEESDAKISATRAVNDLMTTLGITGGVDLDQSQGVSNLKETAGARYVIGRTVARGGMGAIIDARDCSLRRRVAMKMILKAGEVTDNHILRFIEEAQITGQLEHPNIVPVHELGVDDDENVFYTMKMVHGLTLDDVLEKLRERDPETVKQYDLLRLLEIFQRVCDALAFAHSRGVIHRDLKPENIMVGNFGEVLVMDWGLGKVLQRPPADAGEATEGKIPEWVVEGIRSDDQTGTHRTMEGAVMGTPRFMSPEQAYGKVESMDHRTDIYSLGAILYNIIGLKSPVDGKSINEVLLKVANGKIPLLSGKPDNSGDGEGPLFFHCPGQRLPDSLAAVAMKALALKPEDRYQTAQALQDDVRAYMTGFATAAEEASPLRKLLLFVKRHKALVAGTTLVILGLAIGVMIAMHQRNLAVAERRLADEARATAVAAQAVAEAAQIQERTQRALAEKNLANFRQAEAERLAISKRAAPEFVTKASQDMSLLNWDAAGESLMRATTFDPQLGDAWYLYGHWHLRAANWADAARCYGRAALFLTGEPASRAEAFAGLVSGRQGDPTAAQWRDLAKFCSNQEEAGLAGWLLLQAAELGSDEKVKFAAREKWIRDQADTLAQRLEEANPEATGVKVGSTIYGQYPEPLRVVIGIHGEKIVNLAPLSGLPVTDLGLSGPISDLSPLAGARLKALAIGRNNEHQLVDLSPLKGMPLTNLNAGYTGFKDLTELAGAPLRGVVLQYGLVRSLDGLQGAPLTSLNIDITKIADLSPITGAPLRNMTMVSCPVTSLEPLRDAPLVSINLEGIHITSLEPLRGKRLHFIRFTGGITDASPLSSSPLTQFSIGGDVKDLVWLRSAYVVHAQMAGSAFEDLSRLAGSPVRDLHIGRSSDYRSLLQCRNLEVLAISQAIPPGIGVLRHHPSLRFVEIKRQRMTAAEFWAAYDQEFPDRTIEAPTPDYKGLQARITEAKQALEAQLTDGTVTFKDGDDLQLTIKGTSKAPIDLSSLSGLPLMRLQTEGVLVRDLEPLRGLPLEELVLPEAGVSDLEPLRSLPLSQLDLRGCPVTDVSPLTESPLLKLNLPKTLTEDLTPFATMRELQYLNLFGCERIKDLVPLLDIPFLEELQVPRQAANIRRMNELKYLTRLGYDHADGIGYFWKYYGPDAERRQ